MTSKTRPSKKALAAARSSASGLVAAGLLTSALAACSSVPDAVNPVEWYKGTRDWVVGEDEEKQAKENKAATKSAAREEAAGDFPSLSSVPERPAVTPENQRALAAKGLAADTERSKYSDEEIRRDTGQASSRPQGVSVTNVPAQAGTPVPAPMGTVPPRPGQVQPSAPAVAPGQPVSTQSVFQQRIAEQNANKLTPEMMMQGFFAEGAAPQQPQAGMRPMAAAPASAMGQAAPVGGQQLGKAAAVTLPFELGSDLIAPALQGQLKQLAQSALAQGKRLRVVGHASNRMTDTAAMGGDISRSRAEAVARAIIGLGVPPGQVAVSAAADTQPVSNVEAANRRVEIFVE